MQEYINSWNQDQITSDLAQTQTMWKLNTPGGPHFGGVWELLARSCKKAMMVILGNRSMTYDSLTTTLCLVEQTLNAPPISRANDDPSDLEALTANHFNLGRANFCIPFIPNTGIYFIIRKMFRLCQAYADMIWKIWVSEHLPQNNVRTQWNKSEANVQFDDFVWLVDNNVKRSHYDGSNQQTHPRKDGVLRSVLIKTHDSTFIRPVARLPPVFNEHFQSENGAGLVGASNEIQKS